MKAKVSEKGQVTIPKRLRERLGIRPGDVLEFDEENGCLVGRKRVASTAVADAQAMVAGAFTFPGMTTDAFIELIRGTPDAIEAPGP